MDQNVVILAAIAASVFAALVALWAAWGGRQASDNSQAQDQMRTMDMARALEALASSQQQLAGRFSALAEAQAQNQNTMAERLQSQERALTLGIERRLVEMTRRMEEGMTGQTQRQTATLAELRERLAVIDAAQHNLTQLSQQVVSLQDILANKQARGAFGEIQLNDLVKSILPPNAYAFQAPLGDNRRVDCLLNLPNPPGPIAIDAKFPLESFHQLRNAESEAAKLAAGKLFSQAILKHVKDISEKYIVPGQTAESALMFLPSEAIYAELHANFGDVVEKSYRAKVWIVSPTTLMATLNTVRAVLKDATMREQAGLIQREVQLLLEDVTRLDSRVSDLDRHFVQAVDDIKKIRISTEKVTKRAERIEDLQLGETDVPTPVAPPAHAPASLLDL